MVKRLVPCLLALLVTGSALAQSVQHKPFAGASEQARAFAQRLYAEVMRRRPVGIPRGADMDVFSPYLSTSLRHRIELAAACGTDWHRQHPGRDLKPEYSWLEIGFFSGGDEYADPSSFAIERVEKGEKGATHVRIRFTHIELRDRPLVWRVTAVLLLEEGHYVVDDVVYGADRISADGGRLSAFLSQGCDGPHWVGSNGKSR